MTTLNTFIINEEYVFIGNKNNFYPTKTELNSFGHFILGKFIQYRDYPLHGDIIPETKAVFENGTVDCRQYNNIINKELALKKNI